jgi:hypothetical protein
MKKIRLLIIFLCLSVALPCFGATKQVMVFGTDDNFDTTTTEYFPLSTPGSALWSSTEYTVVWPAAGIINDLFVELDASTGGGNTSTWTIRVNKATPGSPTSAACANSAACSDTTNDTTVAAGDEISITQIPTGGPTTSDPSWSIVWNPTTSDYTVLVGSSMANNLGTSGTEYLPMHGIRAIDATAFDVSTLFPTGGTLRDLYVELGTAPGAGTSRTFALGTVDCTISESATTCNSGADTQAVTAGQAYTLTSTVSGTPAASIVSYGVVFVPTTSGQFTFHGTSDDALGTADEFNYLVTAGTGAGHWTGTTTIRENLAGTAFTMKNIYFESAVDVGPDTDLYNLFFRNEGSNTTLTCQITGTGAGPWQCNFAEDQAVTSGQELSVAVTDDGTTPVGASSRWALTGFITPTGGATAVVDNGGGIF